MGYNILVRYVYIVSWFRWLEFTLKENRNLIICLVSITSDAGLCDVNIQGTSQHGMDMVLTEFAWNNIWPVLEDQNINVSEIAMVWLIQQKINIVSPNHESVKHI